MLIVENAIVQVKVKHPDRELLQTCDQFRSSIIFVLGKQTSCHLWFKSVPQVQMYYVQFIWKENLDLDL